MNINLHLGAHRTASTHLQQALRASRRQMRNANICYIGPNQMRGGRIPMMDIAKQGSGVDEETLETAQSVLTRKQSWARHMILSEENLLGILRSPSSKGRSRFYPEGEIRLRNLFDALGFRDVTLFIGVRNPASFIVSQYSRRLYSGRIDSFENFIDGLNPSELQWAELVRRLSGLTEVSGIVVWKFEDYPAIAPTVLNRLLPSGFVSQVQLKPSVSHAGLSSRAHAMIMNSPVPESRKACHDLVRLARETYKKSESAEGFHPLGRDVLDSCAETYASDLKLLGTIPGVELLVKPEV